VLLATHTAIRLVCIISRLRNQIIMISCGVLKKRSAFVCFAKNFLVTLDNGCLILTKSFTVLCGQKSLNEAMHNRHLVSDVKLS